MALIVIAAFIVPVLLIAGREKLRAFRKINPLIASYIFGLLIGNIGIVTDAMISGLDLLATVAVALSIPLMLFSVNIRDWFRLSGRAGLSMLLASLSVVFVSAGVYLVMGRGIEEGWKLPGLLTGLYTGGTPNLAAIKTALDVDQNLYLAVHTSDIVLSAIYLLFLMTIAKRVLIGFLKPYIPIRSGTSSLCHSDTETEGYQALFHRETLFPLIGALLLAVLIVAAGAGLSFLVPQGMSTMAVILAVTTLSLLVSLVPKVRSIRLTFRVGEYFIYVFCVAVGAMGNLANLVKTTPKVFLYVSLVIVGTLLLHILLCRLFRIDVDTMLITSTSAICSPPFVGIVAVSIKNKALIVPGITTGIIGYAVGNYLGILLAQLMRLLV